jgi:hypothetical protein
MNPGRELNELIAEHVMGISKEDIEQWRKDANHHNPLVQIMDALPTYSTNITWAWSVVEKLLKEKHYVDIEMGDSEGSAYVAVEIDYVNNTVGQTAPHAICLAALKAVGGCYDSMHK